jgi:hypothetical protein
MKVILGSIIIVLVVVVTIWLTAQPLFSKVGSFVEGKTKKFKDEWEEKDNE